MRRTLILAAALGIIALGLWGTFTVLLDEARMKGLLADRLSEQTGRRVEIVGPVTFSLFPRPRLEARQLVMTGADGASAPGRVAVESMHADLRLGPLIRGRIAPERMRFEGVTVHLDGNAAEVAAESSPPGAGADAERAAVPAGTATERRERPPARITVSRVELERFAPDRPVRFHFEGGIGPFRTAVIDGRLTVSSGPGQALRLGDMRATARFDSLGLDARLEGGVAMSADGPLGITLEGGKLELGEQVFRLDARYRGGTRPALSWSLSGEQLTWSKLTHLGPDHVGAVAWRRFGELSHDMSLGGRIVIDRARLGPLALTDTRMELSTQAGAGLDVAFAASLPGGYIEGTGLATGGPDDFLQVDLAADDIGRVLAGLGRPADLTGSGEARLFLRFLPGDGFGIALDGSFRLWDGQWLLAGIGNEDRPVAFDLVSGTLQSGGGHLDLAQLSLHGGDLDAQGFAAVELASGVVAGLLHDQRAPRQYELTGSLGQMRLDAVAPDGQETPSGEAGGEAAGSLER